MKDTDQQRSNDELRNSMRGMLDRILTDWPVREVVFAQDDLPPLPGALVPGRARLFVQLGGCRHVTIANGGQVQEIALRPGQLLFAGATSWHRAVVREDHEHLSVIFDPDSLILIWRRVEMRFSGPNRQEFRYSSGHPPPAPIMHAVLALSGIGASSSSRAESADCLLRGLLHLVRDALAEPTDAGNRARATWQAMCSHMQHHLQESLSREDVAKRFRVHPNHVSRLFRQQGSENFATYLMRLRLEHAAFLLRKYRLSVKEAAELSGYGDANYFGKAFQRYHGVSPAKYRDGQGRRGPRSLKADL